MTRGSEAAVATERTETEAEVAAVIETTEIAETKIAAETEMTEAAAVATVTTHETAAAEISLETAVVMGHETAAAETSLETAVAMAHETAAAETSLETAVAMAQETAVGETTVMKMPPDLAVTKTAAATGTQRMITRAVIATPAVTETAGETTGTLEDEVNVMTVIDDEATEMTRDETVTPKTAKMIVERGRQDEASATENDLTDEAKIRADLQNSVEQATDDNRPDTISWLAISSAYFLTHPHISETLTKPPCVQSR